jgi:hypothetical protein
MYFDSNSNGDASNSFTVPSGQSRMILTGVR